MSSDVKPALLHDSRGSPMLGRPSLRRQQRQFLSRNVQKYNLTETTAFMEFSLCSLASVDRVGSRRLQQL
jgi:hypothetical protein